MPEKPIALAAFGAAALALAGCSAIPADSLGTYDRASGGNLVVGVSEHAPWAVVNDDTGAVTGSEAELIESFATGIDAEIDWQPGPESVLASQIRAGELDIVIGGLTTSSPWSSHMALTRAYTTVPAEDGATENMVMGVRLGENELLTELERHLARVEGEI